MYCKWKYSGLFGIKCYEEMMKEIVYNKEMRAPIYSGMIPDSNSLSKIKVYTYLSLH